MALAGRETLSVSEANGVHDSCDSKSSVFLENLLVWDLQRPF